MRLATVLTVVAALVVAGDARGAVVRAENVLPPGQSGYVSITGVASGTGSPHLNDQTALFTSFTRKPFDFGQPAEGETETPFDGVSITRDAYGVPSVTGDTELNAWKGAGYAVAQDRMFQLEAFRHATQGRLGDIVGESAVEDDIVARRDFYTAAERRQQFDRLPTAFKARIEAYRDGINVWIEHLQSSPTEVPGEFPATLVNLTPWTVDDTLSVGIFLARTVPSGDGAELSNLRALQESGSPKVLDKLLPLSLKGQRSTIPRSEGLFPQGKPLSAKQARAARKRSLRFVAKLPKLGDTRTAELPPGRIGRVGGSSMFTVRKKGGAILFNGPQLGFSDPGAVRGARGARARSQRARRDRRRCARHRHRPQRQRRLRRHQRPQRRGRPLRRGARPRRAGEVPLQGRGPRHGLPRRDHHVLRPADRPPRRRRARLGRAHGAHLPDRPRAGPAARG